MSGEGAVRIAYTADWHVLEVKGGERVDQTHRLACLVDRLNAESLDLVIHGGDLITRYDVDKTPLDDATIRTQYEQVDDLLARVEAPVVALPGNHDVAFPVCRELWQDRFGPATAGGTWDQVRTVGPVQLLLMDGFAAYDPVGGKIQTTSLTAAQLEWLDAHCAEKQTPWRVLALHYDYENQVLPRLAERGIDCFFYGHSSAHPSEAFHASGCRDGHLPGSDAYRLLIATDTQFHLESPVSYHHLSPDPRAPHG